MSEPSPSAYSRISIGFFEAVVASFKADDIAGGHLAASACHNLAVDQDFPRLNHPLGLSTGADESTQLEKLVEPNWLLFAHEECFLINDRDDCDGGVRQGLRCRSKNSHIASRSF